MTICDWCKREGYMSNKFAQIKPKCGYGKTIQLCRKCRDVLEEYEAEYLFEAAKKAEAECMSRLKTGE